MSRTNLLSKALAIVGAGLALFGLILVTPLGFSLTAASLLLAGSFLMATSVPVYAEIGRGSSRADKVFTFLAACGVVLLSAAIVTYTVVDVNYRVIDDVRVVVDARANTFVGSDGETHSWARVGSTPGSAISIEVTHVYGAQSMILFELSLALLVSSAFVRLKQ